MKEEKRWEKAAERENARRESRAPLFVHAGLVPRTTAAEQKAKVERVQDDLARRLVAHDEQSRRKIDVMRADLRALVGDEAMTALDSRRKIYPKGLEYDLDILNGELAKATGRTNNEVFATYEERPRVAVERLRIEDPRSEAEREHAAELEASEEAAERTRVR